MPSLVFPLVIEEVLVISGMAMRGVEGEGLGGADDLLRR